MSNPKPAAVHLHTPADLAEALPYLLGYRPHTSLVTAAFYHGKFTCAAPLDLPTAESAWSDFATEAARAITDEFARPDRPMPDSVVLYLVDEPDPGQPADAVATNLAPLAGLLHAAFTHHHLTVRLILCISSNQWWDLTHATHPDTGTGITLPDSPPGSVTVAYAAAGQLPPRSEDALTATFTPLAGRATQSLRTALHTAASDNRTGAMQPITAHALLEQATTAFADPATTVLNPADTATLLYALSDPSIRDWAMSLPDTHTNTAARRLFTYLATAAVGSYEVLACAPLTLLAVSAWYDDDRALAHLALRRACHLDPAARLPALLRKAFNIPIPTQHLRDLARAGRSTG